MAAPAMATRQGSVTAAFDSGGGRVACRRAPTTTPAANTAYRPAATRRSRWRRRTAIAAAPPASAETTATRDQCTVHASARPEATPNLDQGKNDTETTRANPASAT